MSTSNFDFLKRNHTELYELARFAEQYVFSDPSSTCVKLRTYGEVLVHFIYPRLGLSFDEGTSFGELLYNAEFKEIIQPEIIKTLHCLRMLGNKGAHPGSHISVSESLLVLKSAYDLGAWLAFLENVHDTVPAYVEPRNPELVLTESQLKTHLEQAITEQALVEKYGSGDVKTISHDERKQFQESSRQALSKIDLEIDHLIEALRSTDLSNEIKEIADTSKKSFMISCLTAICVASVGFFYLWHSLSASSIPKAKYDISAVEALNYIGKDVFVCGKVVQISSYKEWTFMNFEKQYPHMPLVAVITDSNISKFPGLSQYLDKTVCIRGILSSYKGKEGPVASIPLKDANQLSLRPR